MPGFPVVISQNGLGIPVTPVSSGGVPASVATNGLGVPIIETTRGTPITYVTSGDDPTPPNGRVFITRRGVYLTRSSAFLVKAP